MMSHPRIGQALLATAAVVLSLGAGLGLVEGLTRVLFPAFDPSGQIDFDNPVGTLMLGRPGAHGRQAKNTGDFDVAVRFNRHGLRDSRDVSQAGPADLVFVGDSFTWGWGIEERERFSDLVEAGTGVRTFNVSTPTDIAGYRALLDYARALGANIRQVVVAVCMENDLRLYAATPQTLDRAEPDGEVHFVLKPWLERHSAAYVFTTTVVHRTAWLKDLAVRAGFVIRNLDGMSRNDDAPGIVDSSADELLRIAREYRTLVVLIPSRGLWVGPNRAVEDRVHRSLLSALARRGVEVLDLRPLFEAGGQPLGFHFASDPHWTARGHALAAGAISQHLRASGMLGSSASGR